MLDLTTPKTLTFVSSVAFAIVAAIIHCRTILSYHRVAVGYSPLAARCNIR
jgi:ABC-type uncharacterized transport system permease subunit